MSYVFFKYNYTNIVIIIFQEKMCCLCNNSILFIRNSEKTFFLHDGQMEKSVISLHLLQCQNVDSVGNYAQMTVVSWLTLKVLNF